MSFKIDPLDLRKAISYESFKSEVNAWNEITDLKREKMGIWHALNLPNDCEFGNEIKAKVFDYFEITDLKTDTGLEKLLIFLDSELEKNQLDDILDKWKDFENCIKMDEQSMDDFVWEYERKYNKLKIKCTILPDEVLTFMLLRRANLTKKERFLMISQLNFEDKTKASMKVENVMYTNYGQKSYKSLQ